MDTFSAFRKMDHTHHYQVLVLGWMSLVSVIVGINPDRSSFGRYGGGFSFLGGLLIIIIGRLWRVSICELLILILSYVRYALEIKSTISKT